MRYRLGFTVVEIAVVLTIMAILLVLGVGGYSRSQANARDTERKATAGNIAQALERFYTSGNVAGGTTYPAGSYPSATVAQNATFLTDILPKLDRNSFKYSFNSGGTPFFLVDSADTVVEAVPTYVNNNSTTSNIIYQPIALSGSTWVACTGAMECRRYKLFYRTEVDNTIQTIESRVQ